MSAPPDLTRRMLMWADVLESCLPDAEGYDEDTEHVLRNVIESLRREAGVPAEHEQGHR